MQRTNLTTTPRPLPCREPHRPPTLLLYFAEAEVLADEILAALARHGAYSDPEARWAAVVEGLMLGLREVGRERRESQRLRLVEGGGR